MSKLKLRSEEANGFLKNMETLGSTYIKCNKYRTADRALFAKRYENIVKAIKQYDDIQGQIDSLILLNSMRKKLRHEINELWDMKESLQKRDMI